MATKGRGIFRTLQQSQYIGRKLGIYMNIPIIGGIFANALLRSLA